MRISRIEGASGLRSSGRGAGLASVRWGDANGPTVVLLHGMLGSAAYWRRVAEYLPGHDVVALDLLGFGGSPRPSGSAYDYASHGDAVVALLDTLGLQGPVVLVGHSMGALIALRLAAERPDRVRRLVLIGMPVFESPAAARAAITGTTLRRFMLYGAGSRLFCRVWCRGLNPISRRVAPVYLRRMPPAVARGTVDHSWWSYSRSLANVVERQHVAEDMRQRCCPTVVVYGDEDRDASAVSTWGELAGVVVRRLEGGHQLPLDRPLDIATVIAGGSAGDEDDRRRSPHPGRDDPCVPRGGVPT